MSDYLAAGACVAAYLRVSTKKAGPGTPAGRAEWLRQAHAWKMDVFQDKDVDSEIYWSTGPTARTSWRASGRAATRAFGSRRWTAWEEARAC
jgi:hypothetical protein